LERQEVAFDIAWGIAKEEDEWPERISNLLGGGTKEEMFGDTYEAAKEGKTEEEHDAFMEKFADLIDRLLNPPPDPFEEAMNRRRKMNIWDLTDEGIVPHKPPNLGEEE
jgi:hypothetical protein